MRVIIYGNLSEDPIHSPGGEERRVEEVAETIAQAVMEMKPGDWFTLERHENDDSNGLFSVTFPADA